MKKIAGLLSGLVLTAGLATGCADDPDPEEKMEENPPVEQENYNMEPENMDPEEIRNGNRPDEQDADLNKDTERQQEKKMKRDMMTD
ncbi:hypothetical protein [Metabacillus sp. 84]|uniref:hypothetical protein n=1 Tax=Metabacillus sp. 84 TaxID=3404705 RepID=UPI003CEFFB38